VSPEGFPDKCREKGEKDDCCARETEASCDGGLTPHLGVACGEDGMRRVFCHEVKPVIPTIDYQLKKKKKQKDKDKQNEPFQCENKQCVDKDGRPDGSCCGEAAKVSCGEGLHTIFGAPCGGHCDEVGFCCTESKREESDCDANQCRKGNRPDEHCCADPDDLTDPASCSPGYDMFVGALCANTPSGGIARRIFCCKAGSQEDPYSCTDDLSGWTSWPEERKQWCCKNHEVACPGFSLPNSAPTSDVIEERPIRGSQTWHAAGINCNDRGAYPCGDMQHCCCKFGCDYYLEEDGCTRCSSEPSSKSRCDARCSNDAPIVKAHMIPISAMWHGCLDDNMHDCGFGCCCNAGYKWGNETRKCDAATTSVKLREAGSVRPCDHEQPTARTTNSDDADDRLFVTGNVGASAVQQSAGQQSDGTPGGDQNPTPPPQPSSDVQSIDLSDGKDTKSEDQGQLPWWARILPWNWR